MQGKKRLSIAIVIILAVLLVAEALIVGFGVVYNLPDKEPITAVQYLNSREQVENSQFKLGGNSNIEWNYRQAQELSNLETENNYLMQLSYPRIKKISNGDLILIFQEGQVSSNIYMTRSTDEGKTWEMPVILREVREDDGILDTIHYATGDMIQLANGDLLFACSFRSGHGYRANIGDGIEIMISKDFGKTWGEPKVVYNGANWEPSMLQLPTGEIQLYFTQQAPYFAENLAASVDVGLIRSYDGGETWTGPLPGEEFRVETLSRHEHEEPDGIRSCDGMASAVYLNEGKGIVYACESVESGPQKISIVYSSVENNWVYDDYKAGDYGPYDRRWYATGDMRGFAPYLLQFPSGETALIFNTNNSTAGSSLVALGDDEAKNFANFATPFLSSYGAYWSSICLKNSHTIIATAMFENGKDPDTGAKSISIPYAEGQLNHTIDAVKQTIKMDGKNKDWKDDSVLFVGSSSQAQSTVRFAYDDEYLYLLVERLDDYLVHDTNVGMENDTIDIFLNVGAADKEAIDDQVYRFNVSLTGVSGIQQGTADGVFANIDLAGVQTVNAVYGTVNNDEDTDIGYAVEVKIPWSSLGGKPADNRFTTTLVQYNDDGFGITKDTISGNLPTDWFSVVVD